MYNLSSVMPSFFAISSPPATKKTRRSEFFIISHLNQKIAPTSEMTTAQLAEFYETNVDNLQANFRNNRTRFIESKHFFRLEGELLRVFKRETKDFSFAADNRNVLYLWTKRGCARHCKSVGTDRAWEVFELLEDNYFNAEHVTREKPFVSLTDFERGKELGRLAAHTKDPYKRERLVAEAANLILGREIFNTQTLNQCVQLNLFK